jgi:membrane protein required for beta-lactamase induction
MTIASPFTLFIRRRLWLGVLLAIALSFVALFVRLAVGGVLTGFPYLTFFPAVAVIWVGEGRGLLQRCCRACCRASS